MLLVETNRYSMQKTGENANISAEEIRCFLGILILSGYSRVPSKRMYWENNADVNNILVSQAMRRNRFEQILRFFHCENNENFVPNTDKLWKIRPFIEKLKKNFSNYFIPKQSLSFDESMIKYFGKSSLKQFIRGKPIRFGYKAWSLNTSEGYLLDFEIYQGKSVSQDVEIEKIFGKAASPLIKMINSFHPSIKSLPFKFYFDNFFTNFDLLNFLRERGYGGTGTIRENRIPKDCPLQNTKSLKKNARGSFYHQISKEDAVLVCKWVDNSVVCVASNCHGVNPISEVRRFSKKDKKQIQVKRPNVIKEYNRCMGGTDRMDQNVNAYRIRIRNRKFYWPILTWLIDISINNAWIIYKKYIGNVSQLQFRRQIVLTYLQKYAIIPKGPGRPPSLKSLHGRVQEESRFDGLDHLVKKIPDGKRRRCAAQICSSSTRTICAKCNVGLCIDCFFLYHVT